MLPDFNYEPFKEPRGFLKILQWVFCICAFATTTNFSAQPSVQLTCPENNVSVPLQTIHHLVEYPFALDHQDEKILPCKNETAFKDVKELVCGPVGNAKSDSEFFVTTGVLSLLYCTAMIAIFLLADRSYTENSRAPSIDFCVTLLIAVFWLSASSAWANGLSAVTEGSDPKNWQLVINSTSGPKAVNLCGPIAVTGFVCNSMTTGSFGGIVISILFGFINFILWAANLWFLYKETSWFNNNAVSASPDV